MSALFAGKKNNHKGLNLILDIQSDVVTGSLILVKENTRPEVVYFTSQPIGYKHHVKVDYIIKMMIQAVEDVLVRINKDGLEKIKTYGPHFNEIHYILSSPWVISQSKNVKVHYDNETEVTPKIIQKFIDEERAVLSKKYESNLVFVEQKIFEVKLNGYPVQVYEGKRVKDLEVSFAMTLSSDRIIKKIHLAVARHLPAGSKEVYHSALLLHYISVRSAVGNNDEYIVMHTHGELTDIVIVKRGFSSYFSSFSFGTATLVRKLATAMKTTFEIADSSICMCEDNRLEEVQKKKVEEFLLPLLKGWQKECMDSMSCAGSIVLPRKVYLSSPGHFDIFKKSLQDSGFEVVSFDRPLIEIYMLALDNML
jgi:hypothetical protein